MKLAALLLVVASCAAGPRESVRVRAGLGAGALGIGGALFLAGQQGCDGTSEPSCADDNAETEKLGLVLVAGGVLLLLGELASDRPSEPEAPYFALPPPPPPPSLSSPPPRSGSGAVACAILDSGGTVISGSLLATGIATLVAAAVCAHEESAPPPSPAPPSPPPTSAASSPHAHEVRAVRLDPPHVQGHPFL